MSFWEQFKEEEQRRKGEGRKQPPGWWKQALREFPETGMATEKASECVRGEHAISLDVWNGRPYMPYQAGRWDQVLRADKKYEVIPAHKAHVAQRPGLVMVRHGLRNRRMFAQLRPFKFRELGLDVKAVYGVEDEGVFNGISKHAHPAADVHEHLEDGFRDAELWSTRRFWGETPQEHLANRHDSPVVGEHAHRRSWKPHEQKEHGGEPLPRPTTAQEMVDRWHTHYEFAKYVYPKGEGRAKGVDVHPMAWPLLKRGGDVVYFVLEGLLKNDAVLSAGAAVVNVGGVALWEDKNLEWLARAYFERFGLVVVVPDSDWCDNDEVWSQARLLQATLQTYGVKVVVAAPPAKCADGERNWCNHLTRAGGRLPDEGHKNGVDDWLASGGTLAELVVEEGVEMAASWNDWENKHEFQLWQQRQAFERNRAVLALLRRLARSDGRVAVSHRQLADALGIGKSAVGEAIKALIVENQLVKEEPPAWYKGPPHYRPLSAYRVLAPLERQVVRTRLGDYLAKQKLSPKNTP
jgi:hypothetical protein